MSDAAPAPSEPAEAALRRSRLDRWGDLIAPFDEGPVARPPQTLWAFFRWCLRGSFGILVVAALVSVAAGTAVLRVEAVHMLA